MPILKRCTFGRSAATRESAFSREPTSRATMSRSEGCIAEMFAELALLCKKRRAVSPALEKRAARNRQTLAIRKVDIVDWTMPVAEQHGIQELPYLVLFDKEGHQLAAGEKVFDELARLFGDAGLELERATEKP